AYIRGMRSRVDELQKTAEIVDIEVPGQLESKVIFIERNEKLPTDPTQGLSFFLKEKAIEASVVAVVSPDSRGLGYGLRRYEDHPKIDFNRISGENDVHFVHKSGFLAKVNATDKSRLLELLACAIS
ncbi:MAG: hypothetical protein AAGB06_06970, partial [Verrucomicrobiota bacterium]